MGKEIRFSLGGETLAMGLESKVDKRALYGYARRIVEKEGRPLTRGFLTQDGSLMPASAFSRIRVDPEGTPCEEIKSSIDGIAAELQPSSFEQAAELTPASLLSLTEFQVRDVYPLSGSSLAPGVYRTSFAYRKCLQSNDALILQREDQCFLLVGAAKLATFVGLSVAYEFFESELAEDEEDDDDMGFGMI